MAQAIALALGAVIEGLTGVGSAVAISTATATGSEALGSLAGTAVVGTIAEKATTTLVGEKNLKSIAETIQDVKDAYFAQQFNDPKLLYGPRYKEIIAKREKKIPQAVEQPFDIPLNEENNDNTNTNESEIISPNTQFPSSDIINKKIQNYSPRDIADVIAYLSKRTAQEKDPNISKYLDDLINVDDYYKPIGETLLDYFNNNSTLSSDRYKEISQIYNMRDSSGNLLTINGSAIFRPNGFGEYNMYYKDETGKIIGPMKPPEPGERNFTLPQIHGRYGGPLSNLKGSNIEELKPIDLQDLAYYFHDIDYSVQGYFNYDPSDLKLISRLSSLLKSGLIPEDSIEKTKSIILYFSTGGYLMSILKGGNERIGQDYTEDLIDDGIFTLIYPDALDLDTEDYPIERFKFYNELDEAYADSITSSSYGTENVQIDEIKKDINNMKISLL